MALAVMKMFGQNDGANNGKIVRFALCLSVLIAITTVKIFYEVKMIETCNDYELNHTGQ